MIPIEKVHLIRIKRLKMRVSRKQLLMAAVTLITMFLALMLIRHLLPMMDQLQQTQMLRRKLLRFSMM